MTYEDTIKERYRGDKGKIYHQAIHSIPDSAYSWIARTRIDKICRHVNQQDIVLEYGVGMGWNLAFLKCKKRIGFDLSEYLQDIVESHGVEFVGDIASIADGTTNVVICHHVMEHVGNPSEVLTEIRRILSYNGKLLLFVPYEKEKRYRYYNPQEPNHHLYSWNVQTLGNLVQDMGFEVVEGKIGRFGYDRFSAVWANRLRLGELGFKFIRGLTQFMKPAFEVHIVAIKKTG
jgi:SAM-dependent methyltransferase